IDTFYIVLDNKKVIANTDLIFKGRFNSADVQATEYNHKEIYTGKITDKYNKRGEEIDTFYIVLDNKKVIANTDLIFKGRFNSADVQAT
ncbi:hypothetical protein EF900_20040, partial [Staphylococcus aureus]